MSDDPALLLVRAGLVSDDALAAARDGAASQGGTVSEYLVLSGAIDDEALTEFYRTRLLVPRVREEVLAAISPEVVRAVDRDLACRVRAMPISFDDEGNLSVVFSDPSDTVAIQELSYRSGAYVVRTVATQRQLAWCLGHYYDFLTPLGETLLVPAGDDTHSVDEAPSPAPRKRGLTGEVRSMRRRMLVPDGGDTEAVDPDWIAKRSAEVKAQMARDADGRSQQGAAGELAARRASVMIPRGPDEIALPAVVVDGASNGTPELPIDGDADVTTRVQDSVASGSALTAERLQHFALEVSAELDRAVSPPRTPDGNSSGAETGDPVVESLETGTESQPILLTSRPSPERSDDDVVLLERPKQRMARSTALGVGTTAGQSSIEAETRGHDLSYTGAADEVVGALEDTQTRPVSAKRKRKKRGKRETSGASAMTNRPLPRSTLSSSEVDDGWGADDFGPPGTTIPPSYLEARNLGADSDGASIPVEVAESKSEPHESNGAASAAPDADASAEVKNGKARRGRRTTSAPDASDTERLTHTVKELGQTDDRNAVFDLLMDYLSGTHARVAFFAVKKGKVCAWKHKNLSDADDGAEVSLDATTTLTQVVQGQTPYIGSEVDDAARAFLTQATGAAPEDVALAPVAIGPRVIGVLYGDSPHGTLFEQQVAMVTRTAGLALQRILQAAKGK